MNRRPTQPPAADAYSTLTTRPAEQPEQLSGQLSGQLAAQLPDRLPATGTSPWPASPSCAAACPLPVDQTDSPAAAAARAEWEQAQLRVAAHRICPGCGTTMIDRSCKLRCLRCGFFLDCSDG